MRGAVPAVRSAQQMSPRTFSRCCVARPRHCTTATTVMRCDAMRCDAMRCDAMRCEAMRCDAMRCDAMRCDDAVAAVAGHTCTPRRCCPIPARARARRSMHANLPTKIESAQARTPAQACAHMAIRTCPRASAARINVPIAARREFPPAPDANPQHMQPF